MQRAAGFVALGQRWANTIRPKAKPAHWSVLYPCKIGDGSDGPHAAPVAVRAVRRNACGGCPNIRRRASRIADRRGAPRSTQMAILSRTERTTRWVIGSTSAALSTFRGSISDRTWMERYRCLLRAITLSAISSKPARTPILGLPKRLFQFELKNWVIAYISQTARHAVPCDNLDRGCAP